MKEKFDIDTIPKIKQDEVFVKFLDYSEYVISNYGRLYSLHSNKFLLLRGPTSGFGSKMIGIIKNNSTKYFLVSKMVFSHFSNEKIENHEQISPIDGNWDNMFIGNLKKHLKNNTKDLSGQKFGELTAIELEKDSFVKRGDRIAYWKCTCSCGKEKTVSSKYLLKNTNPNCGCKNSRKEKNLSFFDLPGWYWTRTQVNAKDRRIDFDVTIEYAYKKFLEQKGICPYTGEVLVFPSKKRSEGVSGTASLDRIDSSKGYIEGNIQWVHKVVNRLKSDLDEEDFINICKKIANTKSRQNFQKNTKILVTGALGFIGKSLLEYLRDKGHYVDIYVKKNWTKRWEELVELKVHRPFHENILDIIKNYDIVVHLAANSSTTAPENQETWDNNYTLTSSIIEGCIKNNVKLILASSASVYGNSGKINKEDDEVNPQHFYGATKAIIDTNLPIFNNEEIYSLRFFNVYGKNEDRKGKMSSVIYKWLTQDINEGNKIKIFKSNSEKFKDGEQCRDFIFVEDVCSIIYHCMKSEFKGGIYNVGTGKPETWNNVAKIILKIRGLPEEMIEYIDIPEEIKNQYQNFTQACTDKLRNKLGYTKEFTRLEDAIKKTWLEINGK